MTSDNGIKSQMIPTESREEIKEATLAAAVRVQASANSIEISTSSLVRNEKGTMSDNGSLDPMSTTTTSIIDCTSVPMADDEQKSENESNPTKSIDDIKAAARVFALSSHSTNSRTKAKRNKMKNKNKSPCIMNSTLIPCTSNQYHSQETYLTQHYYPEVDVRCQPTYISQHYHHHVYQPPYHDPPMFPSTSSGSSSIQLPAPATALRQVVAPLHRQPPHTHPHSLDPESIHDHSYQPSQITSSWYVAHPHPNPLFQYPSKSISSKRKRKGESSSIVQGLQILPETPMMNGTTAHIDTGNHKLLDNKSVNNTCEENSSNDSDDENEELDEYQQFVKSLGLEDDNATWTNHNNFNLDDDDEEFQLEEDNEDDDDEDNDDEDQAIEQDDGDDLVTNHAKKTQDDKLSTSVNEMSSESILTDDENGRLTNRNNLDAYEPSSDEFEMKLDSKFYEELEEELGGLEEEDMEAALAALLLDYATNNSTQYHQQSEIDEVEEKDDHFESNPTEEKEYNGNDERDGFGKIVSSSSKPMSSMVLPGIVTPSTPSISSSPDHATSTPVEQKNVSEHISSETSVKKRTSPFDVRMAPSTASTSTEVSQHQYEQLQQLLQRHYQLLIQQAVLAVRAAHTLKVKRANPSGYSTTSNTQQSFLGKAIDMYQGQPKSPTSANTLSGNQNSDNAGKFISSEMASTTILGGESSDDLVEILDGSVGMLQDLDQQRKDAIRYHLQFHVPALVPSRSSRPGKKKLSFPSSTETKSNVCTTKSNGAMEDDQSQSRGSYIQGRNSSVSKEDGSSNYDFVPHTGQEERRLTRAQFKKKLHQQQVELVEYNHRGNRNHSDRQSSNEMDSQTLNRLRVMKTTVFDVQGLCMLHDTFNLVDKSVVEAGALFINNRDNNHGQNQSHIQSNDSTKDQRNDWNILELSTSYEACQHVLVHAKASIEQDLIPGSRDASLNFVDAKEFFGNDFHPPCTAEQDYALRRNRNWFTSGEDNLVLRGVNLYGEKQWNLIADRFLPDRSDNIISQRYSKLSLLLYKAHGIKIDENGNLLKPPKLDSVEDIDEVAASALKKVEPPAILNVHRWSLEEDLTLLRAVPIMGSMWAELKARLIPHRDRGHLRKRYQVLERRVKATVTRYMRTDKIQLQPLTIKGSPQRNRVTKQKSATKSLQTSYNDTPNASTTTSIENNTSSSKGQSRRKNDVLSSRKLKQQTLSFGRQEERNSTRKSPSVQIEVFPAVQEGRQKVTTASSDSKTLLSHTVETPGNYVASRLDSAITVQDNPLTHREKVADVEKKSSYPPLRINILQPRRKVRNNRNSLKMDPPKNLQSKAKPAARADLSTQSSGKKLDSFTSSTPQPQSITNKSSVQDFYTQPRQKVPACRQVYPVQHTPYGHYHNQYHPSYDSKIQSPSSGYPYQPQRHPPAYYAPHQVPSQRHQQIQNQDESSRAAYEQLVHETYQDWSHMSGIDKAIQREVAEDVAAARTIVTQLAKSPSKAPPPSPFRQEQLSQDSFVDLNFDVTPSGLTVLDGFLSNHANTGTAEEQATESVSFLAGVLERSTDVANGKESQAPKLFVNDSRSPQKRSKRTKLENSTPSKAIGRSPHTPFGASSCKLTPLSKTGLTPESILDIDGSATLDTFPGYDAGRGVDDVRNRPSSSRLQSSTTYGDTMEEKPPKINLFGDVSSTLMEENDLAAAISALNALSHSPAKPVENPTISSSDVKNQAVVKSEGGNECDGNRRDNNDMRQADDNVAGGTGAIETKSNVVMVTEEVEKPYQRQRSLFERVVGTSTNNTSKEGRKNSTEITSATKRRRIRF